MRASRTAPATPGPTPPTSFPGTPEKGAEAAAAASKAPLPAEPRSPAKEDDWGKLPTKIARELMEAQRENVSAEYRAMVEAYFRAIAEKAREKSPRLTSITQ